MPHLTQSREEEIPLPELRLAEDVQFYHDMLLRSFDLAWLSEEEQLTAGIYHDALCWVLGSEQACLPRFLQAIAAQVIQRRAEQARAN